MKTWIISDTHTFHNLLNIPKVDMVIHCGDFSNRCNPYENEIEARSFLEWYKDLPIKYKILNCGNHDTAVFKKLIDKSEYPDIIWPEHDTVTVNNLKFFISPYTPTWGKGWCYMYDRAKAEKYWDIVPEDIDVLVTHGPPKGILDITQNREGKGLIQVGCKNLFKKVIAIKPRVHMFGHIHDEKDIYNFAILKRYGIDFVNAACYNHMQKLFNNGHMVEL